MIYVLAEMRGPLPWDLLMFDFYVFFKSITSKTIFREEKEIGAMKAATSDKQLLSRSPLEMLPIIEHLRTLDYYKRPDYKLIFNILFQIMKVCFLIVEITVFLLLISSCNLSFLFDYYKRKLMLKL